MDASPLGRLACVTLAVAFVASCRSGASEVPRAAADASVGADARSEPAPAATSDAESIAEAGAPGDASEDAAGDAAPKDAPAGMLLVPGGTFVMGADKGGEEDERPAHRVTVASFWLDRTEVTQAAYAECVTAGKCRAAEKWNDTSGLFFAPNKPVSSVSWFDAKDYCAWLGKRLPREAEFERAVRGDDGRRYPWGNDAPTKERTVFSTGGPEPVGTHPSGRGPYGHDDLAGNVWEWIDDDYDPFAYSRPTAPEGKPGGCDAIKKAQDELRNAGRQGYTGSNPIPVECEKAIRGGAYNYPADGLRSTNRVHHPGSFRLKMTGLRCAKDAS